MATYRLKWDSCETPVEVTLRLNEQQRKAFFTIAQVKSEK